MKTIFLILCSCLFLLTTGAGAQVKTPPPIKLFPSITTDLSASRTRNSEFVAYEKQLSTSSGQAYFKLTSAATGLQKILWQISNAPFGSVTKRADWETPIGLIASGSVDPSESSTFFTIDLVSALGQPPAKLKHVYVRALSIRNNVLAAKPSNDVILDYGTGDNGPIVIKVPVNNLPKDPAVVAGVTIVGYKPPILQTDPYALILTKKPSTGELKLVLEKVNATTPGAKFHLSPDEYERIKKSFSTDQKIGLAVQDFLKALKSGYNWLDDKYNFVANKLAGALAPLVGQENARKMINYYMAMYGINPSYGNFDETLDTGASAFSAFIADSGDVPDDKKGSVVASAGNFINEVKMYANGGGDPKRFYRQDPEFAARPAMVILHVKYVGINGAAANMKGGKRKFKVSIMSGRAVDNELLTSNGYMEYAPVPIFEKADVEVPNGKPGMEFNIPVYVPYTPLFKNDNLRWTISYNAINPAEITASDDSVKTFATKKYTKP